MPSHAPIITSLYVHVPFCIHRCHYCDFYTVLLEEGRTAALVDGLIAELNLQRQTQHFEIDTVFIGGGTPTALPRDEFDSLLAALSQLLPEREVEFTVEANPATVDDAMLRTLIAGQVNRISFGAQSFVPGELAMLERAHGPAAIGQSVDKAVEAGIDNVSIDLIYGIPGQTLQSWKQSLASALRLPITHISAYSLTYEPNTPLTTKMRRGLVQKMDESHERELYETTMDYFEDAGFIQYEISNFARDGYYCKHNLAYWKSANWLGIGPSAASHVAGNRFKNIPSLARYLEMIEAGESAAVESERLPDRQRIGEAAMLLLRLNEGIDVTQFNRVYDTDVHELFAEPMAKFSGLGFLVTEGNVALTRQARFVADTILREFLTDGE